MLSAAFSGAIRGGWGEQKGSDHTCKCCDFPTHVHFVSLKVQYARIGRLVDAERKLFLHETPHNKVCGLSSVSWSKTLCCWVFWMYFSLNTKTQQSALWPISQKLSDSHWNYLDGQVPLQVGVKYVLILGWTAPFTTHFRSCLNNHLSSLLPLPVFLPVWTGWSHGSSQTRARSSGTNFFKLSHPRKALQRLQCWDPYQCFGQSPVNMAPVSPHLQYVWPSCVTSLHGAAALRVAEPRGGWVTAMPG